MIAAIVDVVAAGRPRARVQPVRHGPQHHREVHGHPRTQLPAIRWLHACCREPQRFDKLKEVCEQSHTRSSLDVERILQQRHHVRTSLV